MTEIKIGLNSRRRDVSFTVGQITSIYARTELRNIGDGDMLKGVEAVKEAIQKQDPDNMVGGSRRPFAGLNNNTASK